MTPSLSLRAGRDAHRTAVATMAATAAVLVRHTAQRLATTLAPAVTLANVLAIALFLNLAPVQPAQAQSKASAAKSAQEPAAAAAIRKNLAARLPQMPPVDEVRALPLAGGGRLYEIRVGQDIFYTDAQGRHLIQGQIIDLQNQRNLTEERTEQLTAVRFQDLPFADAFTIQRGRGERQLAVFSDPECGYCRRLERELADIDNVTIHVFLYPVLGPQSTEKSQAVWCAAPEQRARTWLDWMLKGSPPTAQANCPQRSLDALARNLEFGRKHRIQGTPTLFFSDNTRAPGALSARQIEQQFASIATGK